MRKVYSLLLIVVFSVIPLTASAWSFDLPAENQVLDSVFGLRCYKYYDFFNGMSSASDYFTDGQGNRVSGDGCLTLSSDKASIKLNKFDTYQVTSPVEMSNFFIGIGTGALNLRAGVGKDGLHNYGSGARYFAIGDVKKGEVIVCQWGCTTTRGTICQPSTVLTSGGTACTWTDISDSIHSLQANSEALAYTADGFSYWQVESDGYFVIEVQRDVAIQGLQIWLDASADETVSSPSLSLYAVDGESRRITFTPGESTLGAETTVWYGLEDGDTDELGNPLALYLVDGTEVDYYNYVYDIVDGDTIKIDSIPTYKKILDPAQGEDYGPNKYTEGMPVKISSDNDSDGDGYVKVVAATVSENKNFSEIVEYHVAVNEIALNAPVITLVGLNGTDREYSVSWTNNTLCKEDYSFVVTCDGEENTVESSEIANQTFVATESISASVHAEGYTDGETSQEVLYPGIAYNRKNTTKAEASQHDWDFVNLTADQYQMIQGTYSDTIAYIRPNDITETTDTTLYTREQFQALVDAGTLTEGDGTPWNPIDCGWWYDSTKSRATLNVVAPDTIWAGDEIEEIKMANDPNANGYGYVDDSHVQLFNNGLSVSCPPNTNNASCIFIYNNGDLGTYFMAKPTLTFSREAAQYGEYVLMYLGSGGSNYTTSRWPVLYEVPADDLLSVTLQSGGIHVFYIDVYTPGELPEDPYTTSVSGVSGKTAATVAVYDLQGRRQSQLQRGINIVRKADGRVVKLLVK